MVVERFRELQISAVSGPEMPAVGRGDRVVGEEPLEIRVEGAPLAVVMRTPGDDIELAAGFLVSEEVIRSADDVGTIVHCRSAEDTEVSNVINVRLAPDRRDSVEAELARRRAERSTVTSASCGVCGKRTIESLHASAKPFPSPATARASVVTALPGRLRQAQEVFDLTGGLHAAAIFDADGTLVVLREDVGRHNAVDKCVGRLLLTESPPPEGAILMVSGRTSFEIVQKALVARIAVVASVSAPSSLAVDLARASNMALFGFVRGERFNVYAGALDARR